MQRTTAPQRLALISLAGLAFLAAPHALAQNSDPQRPAQQNPSPLASMLAGEWEGQIDFRNADGSASVSLASATCRRESDNAYLFYFEGFAFGNPVDGAMRLSPGKQDGVYQSSGHEASTDNAWNSESAPSENGNSLTFSGWMRDAQGNNVKCRQSVTVNNTSCRIRVEIMGENGSVTPWFTLDLSRMSSGQRSAAADGFDASESVRHVRSAATASAPDDN